MVPAGLGRMCGWRWRSRSVLVVSEATRRGPAEMQQAWPRIAPYAVAAWNTTFLIIALRTVCVSVLSLWSAIMSGNLGVPASG